MKRALKHMYQHCRRSLLGEGIVNFRNQGIVNLIDIGSAGNLPVPWRENANKIQHLLKFEPRDQPVTNPNIVTIDAALWEVNGERDFYIYKGLGGSGSSLFQQNYDYVSENFDQLRRRGPESLANSWFERSQLDRIEKTFCRKLDDILQELNYTFAYDFIKIDAQGAEFQILKGAETFLRDNCIGLHLELFEIPLYRDIKLLPEVVDFLQDFGFDLVKKFKAHGSFDSQHDCLFLKRGSMTKKIGIVQQIYHL